MEMKLPETLQALYEGLKEWDRGIGQDKDLDTRFFTLLGVLTAYITVSTTLTRPELAEDADFAYLLHVSENAKEFSDELPVFNMETFCLTCKIGQVPMGRLITLIEETIREPAGEERVMKLVASYVAMCSPMQRYLLREK